MTDTSSGFFAPVGSTFGLERETAQKGSKQQIYSIEIDKELLESVRRTSAKDLGFPLLEEYDFRRDTATPNLPISQRSNVRHRPYQKKSLEKMW